MKMRSLTLNREKMWWLIRAGLLEIVAILAAVAAHDNRLDAQTEEVPITVPIEE